MGQQDRGQQDRRQLHRNSKGSIRFSPWMVLGIAILIVIGAMIIPRLNKDESPPKPEGERRISRVNLVIQSNVGGAHVYLDGQLKTMTSDTHHQATLFNLAPQTYQITLKKPDYSDQTEAIELTGKAPSQTVRIDMQPIEATK